MSESWTVGSWTTHNFSVNLSSYTLNSGYLVNPYFPSRLIPSKPANNNPLPPQACHARPTVATLPPPSIPPPDYLLLYVHNTNLHIFSVASCFRSHICLFLFYSFFRFLFSFRFGLFPLFSRLVYAAVNFVVLGTQHQPVSRFPIHATSRYLGLQFCEFLVAVTVTIVFVRLASLGRHPFAFGTLFQPTRAESGLRGD